MGTRSGFSLVEVLVAAALIGLLVVMAAAVVVPAMTHAGTGSKRVEVQQCALTAAERLSSDVQNTAPGAVAMVCDQKPRQLILVLHPLDAITETGRQTWAPRLVVWHWTTREERLERWQWPSTDPPLDPGAPSLKDEAQIRALVQERRYGSWAAASVASLEIYGGDAPPDPFPTYTSSFEQPLNIRLRVRSGPAGAGQGPVEFSLLRRVYQMNSVR